MSTPWSLIGKHLRHHWVRSGLTVAAMTFALFLFCFLDSIVTSLDNAVTTAATNRLVVQSAVSLFVELPIDYQSKIETVPGVETVSKLQWFGGYYQTPESFFAQFAVDQDTYFDIYADAMAITEARGGVTGPGAWDAALEALDGERRGAIVGAGLVRDFGWQIGDTVPIIPTIFEKLDGSAWEFVVVGVYEPLKQSFDDRTMFFRYDYFKETVLEQIDEGEIGVGVYVANLAPGVDPATTIDAIDGLFANGPQRTKTTTEAAFQAIFVSMLGNVPLFLGTIGGAVVFAVLFSVVNTMLMAARQRRQESGILKAVGFSNGVLAKLLVVESVVLSLIGGGIGIAIAKGLDEPLRQAMGAQLPTYAVEWSTVGAGAVVALAVGIVAGIGPAWSAARLQPVDALRSEG